MLPAGIILICLSLAWGFMATMNAIANKGIASIPDLMLTGTLFLSGCVLLAGGNIAGAVRQAREQQAKAEADGVKAIVDQLHYLGRLAHHQAAAPAAPSAANAEASPDARTAHTSTWPTAAPMTASDARAFLQREGVEITSEGAGWRIRSKTGVHKFVRDQQEFDAFCLQLAETLWRQGTV
ncbi:hypothetical protein FHP25_24880 [Vineibacter terrae]|uniref:Uncharacterized protein n=1 Tax=Vineibacter terrae TaxID=2586908 RepID=A0A5C8PFH4_9HYPH|nr:hypothetical protein [Vineibacter terrae]TXL72533.1 hypothetical protein FHP25_24880 [Vineibacter terrae]